jgi:hypothetical protein
VILLGANHDWIHLRLQINPLEIIILLFIRFVLNYSFVRKNLLMKIRLRKLSPLCFHQIGSTSISTVLKITNVT